MTALIDNELQQVMSAAKNLPVEKRGAFLERVAATLTVRRVSLEKCIADAIQVLRQGPRAA